jgi:DNA-binding response OmpR family regulator
MKKYKILVAEDDLNLGELLKDFLTAKEYDVVLCRDGEEAFKSFKSEKFDLCVLDVMMPKKDGFTLAKEIRQINKEIPIIFLTAKSQKQDTLEGFMSGADDYITKPFSMDELLKRIEVVIKRVYKEPGSKPGKVETPKEINIGKFIYNPLKQTLIIDNQVRNLTTKENELLKLLTAQEGGMVPRKEVLEKIWGADNFFTARSMDVYISKLRKYLKKDPSIEIINIHGKGFKLIVHE